MAALIAFPFGQVTGHEARNGHSRARGDRLLWAAGGSLLAAYGLRQRSVVGAAIAGAGGMLAYRSMTGKAPAFPSQRPRAVRAITVMRSPQEVFAFWREPENLQRLMHPREGESDDHQQTGPDWWSRLRDWKPELVESREPEYLLWRSGKGSPLKVAAEIQIQPQPQSERRGTAVYLSMKYALPGGPLGIAAASPLKKVVELGARALLQRSKQLMETGEIATTAGQPTGMLNGHPLADRAAAA